MTRIKYISKMTNTVLHRQKRCDNIQIQNKCSDFERVVAVDEREDVLEMTNEEYRTELRKIFDGVDSNRILRYFYILLPKLIKEWQ